jgi:hypothetical protein
MPVAIKEGCAALLITSPYENRELIHHAAERVVGRRRFGGSAIQFFLVMAKA